MQTNRVDQAKRLNDEILKLNAKDPLANTFAADIDLRTGKTADAITTLQPLLQRDPDNARAHYLLGIAFDQSGQSDQAEKEWREAARLRPDMVAAQEAMAKLAVRTGNTDLLAGAAEQLIKIQPSSPDGYLFRSGAENARQQADRAEADITNAIKLAPQSSSGYLALARLRLSQRKFTDALTNFQLALDREPNSSEALAGLAQAYVDQKQPGKAIAAVNEQIAKYPNNSGFYYTLGSLQFGSHDLAAASASLQKAIELNGANFPALYQLGRLDLAQGDFDKASQQWNAWLSKDPRNPNPAWLLGRLEDSRNNWQKAQEYYQKALQVKPDFAPAANDLAYLMLSHGGNSDVALSLAQAARRGLPDSPNSADTLAFAYIQKKIYGSAIDLLQDAIKKSPPNATFEYHLGLAYQQNGNSAEARKHLSQALTVDPKFAQAVDARKALQELGT